MISCLRYCLLVLVFDVALCVQLCHMDLANTPLYSLSSGPQINMVKQKKCIATIFEHIFLY